MQPDLQREHDSSSELRNAAMIARNGDSRAFEAIMRRHNQRLYHIVLWHIDAAKAMLK